MTEQEVRERPALFDDLAEKQGRFNTSRKTKLKFIAGLVTGALAVGGGLWTRNKLEEATESRINTNLETRLHDYGFPFDTASNPVGKIDVYNYGKRIDIRCGKAAKQVVGLFVENNSPNDINIFLPMLDTQGNELERKSWPIGSPEQVNIFLEEDLPKHCAAVESALASNK